MIINGLLTDFTHLYFIKVEEISWQVFAPDYLFDIVQFVYALIGVELVHPGEKYVCPGSRRKVGLKLERSSASIPPRFSLNLPAVLPGEFPAGGLSIRATSG